MSHNPLVVERIAAVVNEALGPFLNQVREDVNIIKGDLANLTVVVNKLVQDFEEHKNNTGPQLHSSVQLIDNATVHEMSKSISAGVVSYLDELGNNLGQLIKERSCAVNESLRVTMNNSMEIFFDSMITMLRQVQVALNNAGEDAHGHNNLNTLITELQTYLNDSRFVNFSEYVTVLCEKMDLLQAKINMNGNTLNREFPLLKKKVVGLLESVPSKLMSLDSRVVLMNMSIESDFDFIKRELHLVNETLSVQLKQTHSKLSSIDTRMNEQFNSLESKLDTIIDSELPLLDTRVSGLDDAVRGNLTDVKIELRNVSNITHTMSKRLDDYARNVSMKVDTRYATSGWREVVYLDMTDPDSNCPPGWQLTGYSKRSCGRVNTSRESCDSVLFPVAGGSYNQVWGRIKAYQWGRPMAFSRGTIDSAYFSGVAVMHGNPREHIWTFAAGGHENDSYHYLNCHCDSDRIDTTRSPPFVGDDYFCESGYVWPGYWNSSEARSFHSNDILWDGQDCHFTSTCCSLNNPPYFTKLLSRTSTDDLELRMCNINSFHNSNIALEFVELYVNLDYIQTKLQKVDDKMKESFAHQTKNINNLHVHQCGGTGGWRRAVYLDMTDPSTDCPPGWTLTGLSKRTCTRSRSIEWTCDSAFFPVSGGQYNQVCGGIKAYQFGVPRAFQGYRYGQSDIDNAYFDGVAVMHGSPRQHVWTFTAGSWENAWKIEPESRWHNCPCDNGYTSVPPFVGDDYFCESGYVHPGYRNSRLEQKLHTNDTLWDGKDCLSTSTCCTLQNPPFFTKNLSETTSDDLELRMCDFEYGNNVAIELVELFVKLEPDLHQPIVKIPPSQDFYDHSLHVHTCGDSGGWRRAVYLNFTDPNTACPSGWTLTGHSKRTCRGLSDGQGSCNSATFSVKGGPYHQVCGRIRAYQWETPTAFDLSYSTSTVDDPYFDGVAVMHGTQPRYHVWTFAAGSSENSSRSNNCPCDIGYSHLPPPFVGEDYFCESGYVNPGYYSGEKERRLHVNDTLWDGEDCHHTSTCCSHHNPPYFTKTLDRITNDDLEMRTCTYGSPVAVELVELYVK